MPRKRNTQLKELEKTIRMMRLIDSGKKQNSMETAGLRDDLFSLSSQLGEALNKLNSSVDSNQTAVIDSIQSLLVDIDTLRDQLTNISLTPGPKGDKGDRGDDGHTPSLSELHSIIEPLIPTEMPESQVAEITARVQANIVVPQPIDVWAELKQNPDALIAVINSGEEFIDQSRVHNLVERFENVERALTKRAFIYGGGGSSSSTSSSATSFESVSQNLSAYNSTIAYSGDNVVTVTYSTPGGSIVKTFNYTGDDITSIVLSGAIPSGIATTKTLTYTSGNVTGVAYS